jgi:hypothetical protein
VALLLPAGDEAGAEDLPKLRRKCTTRTRGSRSTSWSSAAPEPSRLPSSTNRISKGRRIAVQAAVTCAYISGIDSRSSKSGIRIER